MPFTYSRGSTASDKQILAGELAALGVQMKGFTSMVRRLNVAMRKSLREQAAREEFAAGVARLQKRLGWHR